ncbi:hypothetical protein HPB48_003653 [Haemaphysalis longicornis]|uniref:Uncharacterized protein n=1 Tax=Haemaphysalis longicornis TaxID=44386 RepID=A0A9J6FFS4_HAELO|nr:hypothetical protein HPB48_003653 [Haemaphysalis longicornis]
MGLRVEYRANDEPRHRATLNSAESESRDLGRSTRHSEMAQSARAAALVGDVRGEVNFLAKGIQIHASNVTMGSSHFQGRNYCRRVYTDLGFETLQEEIFGGPIIPA